MPLEERIGLEVDDVSHHVLIHDLAQGLQHFSLSPESKTSWSLTLGPLKVSRQVEHSKYLSTKEFRADKAGYR